MTLSIIHLRKLVKFLYLDEPLRTKQLRDDIRSDLARERNGADGNAGGGDFYAPFWRDAKDHTVGLADLHDATRARIGANAARANLYPQLRDGFLLWWNERRRWTNEPFQRAVAPRSHFVVPGVDTTIKVEGLLSVSDGRGEEHYVYPYWFPEPTISDEAARVSLWILGQALTDVDADELRFLDVIRGEMFTRDRVQMTGHEAEIFVQRFGSLQDQWDRLRELYN